MTTYNKESNGYLDILSIKYRQMLFFIYVYIFVHV